jgi:hypothetical protein
VSTVYLADIHHLARRLGDQIEGLAERAGADGRNAVISCALAMVGRRFAGRPGVRSALFLASIEDGTEPAPSRIGRA